MIKRYSIVFAAAMVWVAPALAQPSVTAVVNGASFQPGVPRGCLVSIFGSKLAGSTVSASVLPLPKKLANTVVTVGDLELEAPLYFVSPGQINAQIPFEVLGNPVSVFVTTSEGKSSPFFLTLSDSGPALFTKTADGKGRALVFGPDFQPVDTVAAGRPIILYATGLGPTDPPLLSGSPGATAEPLNRVVSVPDVFAGDFPAPVAFAGLAPGLAGVYQLNVIPQRIGSDRLFVRSRGRISNIVSIGIAGGGPGQNVANASGTIQAIYPTTDPAAGPVAYSPLLVAAKITARMDILPSAGPFLIVATSDAATSIISVDPAGGAFEGTVTVPSLPARVGDFSASGIRPIDFLTCHRDASGALVCEPFPGGILPASRISLFELRALTMVPLPNTPVPNSPNWLFNVRGAVQPGSTFVIDDQNNSNLSVFAGYIALPVPPTSGSTTLKLFIDGNLVASTDVAYKLPPFLPTP